MKKIKLKDCKVGDYLYVKNKNGNLRYLDMVTTIKGGSIFVDYVNINNNKIMLPILKYEYNSYSILNRNLDVKFFRLNEKEKEKIKIQLTEMKI